MIARKANPQRYRNALVSAKRSLTSGDTEEAVNNWEIALLSAPASPTIYLEIAREFQQIQRTERALQILRMALQEWPHQSELLFEAANTLRSLGRVNEAIKTYAALLDLDPLHTKAFENLVRSGDTSVVEKHFGRFSKLLDDGVKDVFDKISIAFSLGLACDQMGKFEQAANYFDYANNLLRTIRKPSNEGYITLVRGLIGQDSIYSQGKDFNNGKMPSPKSIFILSLPRSGSTLLEQTLAQHSQVFTLGESTFFGQLLNSFQQKYGRAFPDVLKALRPEDYQWARETYQAYLTTSASSAAVVINKYPTNHLMLGFIAAALPDAKFINLTRNSLDIALSCYCQPFESQDWDFTCDLKLIGQRLAYYEGLSHHWDTKFGEEILNVDYFDLISSFGPTVGGIMDFLGLPWEDACNRPEESKAAVRNSSEYQVRRKLYRSSLSRWDNYPDHKKIVQESLETTRSEIRF